LDLSRDGDTPLIALTATCAAGGAGIRAAGGSGAAALLRGRAAARRRAAEPQPNVRLSLWSFVTKPWHSSRTPCASPLQPERARSARRCFKMCTERLCVAVIPCAGRSTRARTSPTRVPRFATCCGCGCRRHSDGVLFRTRKRRYSCSSVLTSFQDSKQTQLPHVSPRAFLPVSPSAIRC